jgi:hypothetical protein
MGFLSVAVISYKQFASLEHPVIPVVLRDKIKGTFVIETCIDRRNNPFLVLLSVQNLEQFFGFRIQIHLYCI